MLATICLAIQLFTSFQAISWTHLSSSTGDLPAPNSGQEQTASLVLDIDKNGIDDFAIAERTASPSFVWFRRSGSTWTKYVIENTQLPIEAGGAFCDIDGDGDLDIVMGGDWQSNQVWWWENPYPNFEPSTPWTRRLIKNSGGTQHHDQIFGDFDSDGKPELVFWNQGSNALILAEIPANPYTAASWTLTTIYSYSGTDHEGLDAGDVDSDGKLDIIGGGRWFKHVSGTTFTANVIDDTQRFTRAAAGQLTRGGWLEVVFVPGDEDGPIRRYSWDGSAWSGLTLLPGNVIHGHSLQIADINNDGKLDIFNAEMRLNGGNSGAKMRIFFGDGNGNFTVNEVATGFGNHESRLGDFDGDGDLDILDKPYNWNSPRIDLWMHNGTGLTLPPYPLGLWQRHVVDANKPWQAVFVTAADMDNDGLRDIITGGWWYKNPGLPTGSWTRNTIGSPLNNMAAVFDFDNDGSMDVLGTQGQGAATNAQFVWGRNNGSGVFTILNNVSSGEGDFLQGVEVTRMQPGSAMTVALSWHDATTGVQALTVPSDPSVTNWAWQRISTTAQGEQLSALDLEQNGTQDLILGTQWLRNSGTAWTSYTLNSTGGEPDRNRMADINRDGHPDVVVGFEAISAPAKLAWYEQPVPPTGTWTEHVISSSVVGPMSLDVADMDHDGDIDVIVGEHNLSSPSSAKMIIFENAGGSGVQWNQHTVFTGDEHHDGAFVADIDNDGDLDIISIGWNNTAVVWYENRAIVKPDQPVPVQLASFTGSITGQNTARLNWTTLSETNNFGFVVQRRTAMSNLFLDRPNSFIAGHGTTVEPHSYQFLDTLDENNGWLYRLKQIDLDGSLHYSDAVSLTRTTGVQNSRLPEEFFLSQNYPNPFNPTTRIEFSLPKESRTRIEIFDMLGRLVAVPLNMRVAPGDHSIEFDARKLSGGVYFYRLTTNENSLTKKMILIR